MTPRAALILLSLVCPVLLFLLVAPGTMAVWLIAPLVCGLPVLLIVVGSGRRPPSAIGLAALWMILTVSWLGLLWMSEEADLTQASVAEASLVLGLMLVGLGLLPLTLVGWLFARWFAAEQVEPIESHTTREGRGS